MILANIIFSLIYAVSITAVFHLIFKKTGPWDGFWLLFILLFLVSMGAGKWVTRTGPEAWGYHWLPGLVAAVIFALLVAAATPDSSKKNRQKVDEETEVNTLAVNFFFILLIIILVILAITGVITY